MSKSTGNFLTLQQAVEKFGADATRFNLADAGDTIEDANFIEANANATILRLYGMIEWTKEVLASKDTLRKGDKTFYDRVLESEINQAIERTLESYESMMYREALKNGAFELQGARDRYREMASDEGMHLDTILRYIEVQALLLCPVCPHVSEHIWTLLDKSDSIMKARAPVPGPVDVPLVQSAAFLRNCAHDLRLKIRTFVEKKIAQRPQYATVYVAEVYPTWQEAVLKCLKESYNEATGEFQENKEIALKLKNIPELKKYSKKAMPFAQMVKENVQRDGATAMDLTTPFNQLAVLKENLSFLERTVDLFSIDIQSSLDGDDRAKEESVPWKPFAVLHITDPRAHVMVQFRNPQVGSGHFSMNVAIHDGDTIGNVANSIRKLDGNIKGEH
jgi:leucyl-tRNA synthetase